MGIVVPDMAMLREPNLLIPRKKPIGPVKIDWDHPLSDNVSFCVLPGLLGSNTANLANGDSSSIYDSASNDPFGPRDYGLAFSGQRSSSTVAIGYIDFTGKLVKTVGGASAITVTAIYHTRSAVVPALNFIRANRNVVFSNEYNTYGNISLAIYTGNFTYKKFSIDTANPYPTDRPLIITTASWNGGSDFKFWLNGIYYTSSLVSEARTFGSTINSKTPEHEQIRMASGYGSVGVDSSVYLVLIHKNRVLTHEEVLELHADPYQFLIPE